MRYGGTDAYRETFGEPFGGVARMPKVLGKLRFPPPPSTRARRIPQGTVTQGYVDAQRIPQGTVTQGFAIPANPSGKAGGSALDSTKQAFGPTGYASPSYKDQQRAASPYAAPYFKKPRYLGATDGASEPLPANWTQGAWDQLSRDQQMRFAYASDAQKMAIRSAMTDGNLGLVAQVLANVQAPDDYNKDYTLVSPASLPAGWSQDLWNQLDANAKAAFPSLSPAQQEDLRQRAKAALEAQGKTDLSDRVVDLQQLQEDLRAAEQRVAELRAMEQQHELRLARIEGAAAEITSAAKGPGMGTLLLLGALGVGGYYMMNKGI